MKNSDSFYECSEYLFRPRFTTEEFRQLKSSGQTSTPRKTKRYILENIRYILEIKALR